MLTILLSILFVSFIGALAFFIYLNHVVYSGFHLEHVNCEFDYQQLYPEYKEHFAPTVNGKKIQLQELNPQSGHPVILAVHGQENCSEAFLNICKKTAPNCRIFLLNTRNHGKSDDSRSNTIIQYQEDIEAAVHYIINELNIHQPITLLGHSMGGASVLNAAQNLKRVKAVISIASFADLRKITKQLFITNKLPPLFVEGALNYLEIKVGKKIDTLSPLNAVRQLKQDILICHGKKDTQIPVDEAYLFRELKLPNTEVFISENANHSNILDEEITLNAIEKFIAKLKQQ
jgi:pimeloyl-ACP methyl ester carboxylesterase